MGKASKSDRLEAGLELISTGLSQLGEASEIANNLSDKKLVDIAARINAQAGALDAFLAPLKDKIKATILEENQGSNLDTLELRGDVYKGVLKKIIRNVLNTASVKVYLGKKLNQFTETRNEMQLSFTIKE